MRVNSASFPGAPHAARDAEQRMDNLLKLHIQDGLRGALSSLDDRSARAWPNAAPSESKPHSYEVRAVRQRGFGARSPIPITFWMDRFWMPAIT
jgi:hypothetical protein